MNEVNVTSPTTEGSEVERVVMPRELTSENGAKYLFIGEFTETIHSDCPACENRDYVDDVECWLCEGSGRLTQEVAVSWSTIKEIYKKAVEHLAV